MPAKRARSASPAAASPTKTKVAKVVGNVDPDLPMDPQGVIYHLGCRQQDVADKFIFVGDPGRVSVVAERFDKGSLRFTASHREINIMTGKYKGVPVTCLSTGMGTDNIEIVINEIHALKEYDVTQHKWATDKARKPQDVHIIRVGTCGCPRPDVEVGTLAITSHAIGMDNTCRYYHEPAVNATASVKKLKEAVNKTTLGKVGVYATRAHEEITSALVKAATALKAKQGAKSAVKQVVGTTASGSGFYGCQGRIVGQFRGRLTVPNLVDELGSISFPVGKGTENVVNIEMENSALCYLSNLLGYKAGTVCAVVARRAGEMREFASPAVAKQSLADAITVGLDALISV